MSLPIAFCIDSYGVKLRFRVGNTRIEILARRVAEQALVGRLEYIADASGPVDHEFRLYSVEGGLIFEEDRGTSDVITDESEFEAFLNSMIRVYVGINAKDWVFVHCGVVGWRQNAILLPGHSHQGKTTLVAELIRAGAVYYSDEFAVIDADGLIHPFERDLSVRIKDGKETMSVSSLSLGASVGKVPIPAGLVLLTNFEPGGCWKPEKISLGEGILEAVPNVLPVRYNTKFSLKVLNTAFSRAIIVKSKRGEASEAAPLILSYFEEQLNSTLVD